MSTNVLVKVRKCCNLNICKKLQLWRRLSFLKGARSMLAHKSSIVRPKFIAHVRILNIRSVRTIKWLRKKCLIKLWPSDLRRAWHYFQLIKAKQKIELVEYTLFPCRQYGNCSKYEVYTVCICNQMNRQRFSWKSY